MIPSVCDLDVAGRRLVVRADLNVPMQDGQVSDSTRIDRFATGMKALLANGAALVILSHFGRPNGQADTAFSLSPLRESLENALGVPVTFTRLEDAKEAATHLRPGSALLVENLRFDPGEEANCLQLAHRLAALGDIYVNDAFSCAHRAHASTEALARILPSAAGPLMAEEIAALRAALDAPARPSAAIVGGSKISTKIAVLRHLVSKVDHLIIGGGMANTFLYAQGLPVGKSLHEKDQAETVRDIIRLARVSGCTIHLPTDIVVAREFRADVPTQNLPVTECPADAMILDAGPDSVAAFRQVLDEAETILWNGPLGAFETPPFHLGTVSLAQHAAERVRAGNAVAVAGGGDTVAALNTAGVTDDFTYVSTAGGAFLEWLEGRELPGIAALKRHSERV
ncbi:phosphoglycerate kinase [Xanthobacter sp. TB0139]|uniref:phosphoglycerate kinase n=1 Tax=Xanthobacter sp. TB0139 TaxID=3459178 RepID=UPI0040393E86